MELRSSEAIQSIADWRQVFFDSTTQSGKMPRLGDGGGQGLISSLKLDATQSENAGNLRSEREGQEIWLSRRMGTRWNGAVLLLL